LFHVKRGRHVSSADDPHTIGREVRERVVAHLAKLGFAPTESDKFPDRIEKFATNLALWGKTTSLTARPNDPSEIAFHVIDSLMPAVIATGPDPGPLAGAFGPDHKVLDVGSGAGFPGLVLAAATPAVVTLVESRRKRASFLSVAVAEMGLVKVRVDSAHATPSHVSPEFDVVMARAVGEPALFYGIAMGALRRPGLAILYTSRSQRLSLNEASAAGLTGYTRRGYVVERDGAAVERVLAIWSKP
jgi:16S rRNA G527 N7-methylase RsmG